MQGAGVCKTQVRTPSCCSLLLHSLRKLQRLWARKEWQASADPAHPADHSVPQRSPADAPRAEGVVARVAQLPRQRLVHPLELALGKLQRAATQRRIVGRQRVQEAMSAQNGIGPGDLRSPEQTAGTQSPPAL